MLLTVTKGLGIDDDLMFAVDGGHTVITLNRALARCHLGRFIVGDITFYFFLDSALPNFWILSGKEFIDAIGGFI